MNCRNIHRKLSAYMDAELPENPAREVRMHLEECPRCRRAYQMLVALNNHVERSPSPPVPTEDFTRSVMKRIGELPVKEKRGLLRWAPSTGYAGLFAAFLLAGFLFLPHPVRSPVSASMQPAWMEVMEEDAYLHLSQLQDPQIASLWSELHETAE